MTWQNQTVSLSRHYVMMTLLCHVSTVNNITPLVHWKQWKPFTLSLILLPTLPPFCPDSDSGAKYCTEQILFSVGRSRRSDNDFGSHLKMDWKLSDDPWDSVFSCNSHEQTRHTECSPLTSQPVCLWWWLQTAPTWPAWLQLRILYSGVSKGHNGRAVWLA